MAIVPVPGACVTCGNGGGGTPPTPTPERDVEGTLLCDFDANDDIVGSAIAVYVYDEATGAAVGAPTFVVPGTNTPYVVQGTLRPCTNEAATPSDDSEVQVLCDVDPPNGITQFLRRYLYNSTGAFVGILDTALDGTTAYAPVGSVVDCVGDTVDREGICYTLTSTGVTVHTGWARHDDNVPSSPVTPNGIIFFDNLGNFLNPTVDGFTQVVCENPSTPAFVDDEYQVLCDNVGSFLRRYRYLQDANGNVFTSTSNFQLDGSTPYAPLGPVVVCSASSVVTRDEEVQLLCDLPSGVSFLRRYNYDGQTGAIIGITDTTLNGSTPYVVVGTAGVCASTSVAHTYSDTVQDITGAPFNVVPGANLVSLTIRNRNATTATYQVNGGAVLPMDVGEQWSSDVNDPNGTLTDTMTINPGDGTVRLTIQRRF